MAGGAAPRSPRRGPVRKPNAIALAVLGLGAISLYLGITGTWQLVSGIVLASLSVVLSIPFWIWGRIERGHDRDAAAVRELPERGLRVQGIVTDVLPLARPEGGPVFTAGGAQMVLRVDLDRGGRREAVTVHLVENSETARSWIGRAVTVVEHPDDRQLRSLEGYFPNGRRA